MFCTGGIRCEIASSFMLSEGFTNVSQLEGGVLRYLNDVQDEKNLWQGECFVFDDRVTVDKNLKKGDYLQCFGCRRPLTKDDLESEFYKKEYLVINVFIHLLIWTRKGLLRDSYK